METGFCPLCSCISDCRILYKPDKTSGKDDAIHRISDPVFRSLKLLFRPEAQRICKLMRLSLHRTALLFWCCLFRYFRAASYCKAGFTSGYIKQCIFPFLAVLRPSLHASFFHSKLCPVLLCRAHSSHYRRGIKTNGMDADPAFHLRPDCSHIRSDLPDRLALGLL